MADNAYNELAAKTAQRQTEAQAALQKRMSDLGLASAPLTLQNQQQMAAQANLGQISRQQQGQASFDEALARQNALNLEAQKQGASAKQSFGDTQSTITLQSIKGFGEQQLTQQKSLSDIALAQQNTMQGLDIGLRKSEYAMDEQSRQREMYYQLFLKRKLSAKQFQDKTGIAVKAFSSGKKRSTGLFATAAQSAEAARQQTNAAGEAALNEQQVANAGPGTTSNFNRMDRANAAVTANPVKQSITYRDVLNDVSRNQIEYVTKYGTTEYNRAVTYLGFRADAEDNGIDLEFFAPSYQQYADLIENPDKYIQQYGKSGYTTIVNSVYGSFKNEMANVQDAIALKNSGAFSADVLAMSPGLAQKYQYTTDPEDVARQHLGLVPIALEKDAKKIIQDARDRQTQSVDDISLNGEKGTAPFSWDSTDYGNAVPTQEELIDAVKYLSWQDEHGTWSQQEKASFSNLTPEQQQLAQDQHFAISEIEYKVNNLTPEQLSQAATGLGLPETATKEDVVDFFRDQQAQRNETVADLELSPNATGEEVQVAQQEQIKTAAKNLGLPDTATIEDVQAEYQRYEADPIAWTNEYYNKNGPKRTEQAVAQIEAERSAALNGLQQVGADQASIDKLNAMYDQRVVDARNSVSAEQKQAIDFIQNQQLIESYDKYKSNSDFIDVSNEWLESRGGDKFGMDMTDEQRRVYAYLMATDRDEAGKYFNAINDSINQEFGKRIANEIGNTESPGGKNALRIAFGVIAGISGFFEGVGQLFSGDPLDPSGFQYASQNIRNDMIANNEKIARFAYDFAYSAGNMAPTIALSMLTGGIASSAGVAAGTAGRIAGAIGSTALGLSAGGNAYGEALRMGYTPAQARTYGALIGLSEGGLQFLMGGISGLSSGLTNGVVAKTVSGINNVYLKAAMTLGLKGLSEGAEEYLQEIIDPLLRNAVLGENNEINLLAPQNFEAALMGALMAFAFDGRSVYKETVNTGASGVKTRTNTAEALRSYVNTLDDGTVKDTLNKVADSLSKKQGVQAPVVAQDESAANMEQTVEPVAKTTPQSTDTAQSPDNSRLEQYAKITERRLNADEMNIETKRLSDTGKVEISRDMSITETLDALEAYRSAVNKNINDLGALKALRIGTKGLTKKDLVAIGKALEKRDTAVRDLDRIIRDVDKRESQVFKKTQTQLLKAITKLQKAKVVGDIKTRIDQIAEKYNTKSLKLSPEQTKKLETAKQAYLVEYGTEDNFPQYVKNKLARLEQASIAGLTAEELENSLDEVQQLQKRHDFEFGQAAIARATKFKVDTDRIQTTLPSKPILGWFGNLVGSPQRITGVYGIEARNIMFRNIWMASDNRAVNDRAVGKIMDQISKNTISEFGADRGIDMNNSVYDNDLNVALPRPALMALYMTGKDTDGFRRVVEDGFSIEQRNAKSGTQKIGIKIDGPALQEFIANFSENYPDLAALEGQMRQIFDYYRDAMNETHRAIDGTDAITEKMLRDNPNWYHNEVEPSEITVEEVTGKKAMPSEPGFLKERVGGGMLTLANPLYVLQSYHHQANLYTSYAVPVREAARLMSSDVVRAYTEQLGTDKSGKSKVEASVFKFLTDAANGRIQRERVDATLLKLLSSFQKAQIAYNPNVVFAQTGSYPGAMMYIDAKYLFNPSLIKEAAQTIFSPEAREALFDKAPIIYDRLIEGHSMIESGTDIPSYLNKVFSLKGIRYTDALTVTAMYLAAQKQAAATGVDGDALFHDALWNTQDQFDSAFRSQLQKSIGGRILAPFTTQTFQQHNMLWQGLQYKQAAIDADARGETALAEQYRRIAKGSVVGTGASVGMYSVLKVIGTLLLAGTGGDDEKEKSLNKMLSVFVQSGLDTIIPVVSNLAPAWINKGLKAVGSDLQMTDYGFDTLLQNMIDVLNQTSNVLFSDKYTTYGKVSEIATRFAEFFGVPAENIEKYTTELLEEIIPGFEYDYLKKKPTANDLALSYITRGGNLPTVLPSDKQLVYDNYWELVKDTNLSSDEVELAKRLKSLSHAIAPNASTEASANAMYRAMRDRAIKNTFNADEITAINKVLTDNEITVTIAAINSAAKRLGYSGQVSMTDTELYELVRKFYR